MLLDAISDILEFAQGLIVSIPLDNGLAYIYVILNTVVSLLVALFTGQTGSDSGGGILPF
jgi:hypothetical protein